LDIREIEIELGMPVYYGLDLSLSKLSIAQSNRKISERHNTIISSNTVNVCSLFQGCNGFSFQVGSFYFSLSLIVTINENGKVSPSMFKILWKKFSPYNI
jgi:hypothetical protein